MERLYSPCFGLLPGKPAGQGASGFLSGRCGSWVLLLYIGPLGGRPLCDLIAAHS